METAAAGGGRGRALVVGLGGGGLPVFLAQACGLQVDAVELDPVVLSLARQHFGLPEGASLTVRGAHLRAFK